MIETVLVVWTFVGFNLFTTLITQSVSTNTAAAIITRGF